jgi:5-methylcytosine-specific restriction enzyme A
MRGLQAPHRVGRPVRGLQAGADRSPTTQTPMSRTLLRACLGCGRQVRGKPRCRDCQTKQDRAKNAKRPGFKTHQEAERRRRAVAEHRATIGDWCPGVPELGRGAHRAANLTADHLTQVGTGGREDGPRVVRCRPCNSARSAQATRRVLTMLTGQDPSPGEHAITHRHDDDPGPVAA